MATFYRYRCKGCGYEVNTEPSGFYALFSGQYYNFKCSICKDIVSLSASDLYEMEYARASEYTAFLAMKRGGRIVFSVNE